MTLDEFCETHMNTAIGSRNTIHNPIDLGEGVHATATNYGTMLTTNYPDPVMASDVVIIDEDGMMKLVVWFLNRLKDE